MNKTDTAYKSIGEVAKLLNLINKKSRIGRNPLTKEKKMISDRNVVLFKPSKEFKDLVNSTKDE